MFADITKTRTLLNYWSQMELEEGIREFSTWFKGTRLSFIDRL